MTFEHIVSIFMPSSLDIVIKFCIGLKISFSSTAFILPTLVNVPVGDKLLPTSHFSNKTGSVGPGTTIPSSLSTKVRLVLRHLSTVPAPFCKVRKLDDVYPIYSPNNFRFLKKKTTIYYFLV